MDSDSSKLLSKFQEDAQRAAMAVMLEKQVEVLKYCRPWTTQMWAANIVSILLRCDFRDAKQELDKFFEDTNE